VRRDEADARAAVFQRGCAQLGGMEEGLGRRRGIANCLSIVGVGDEFVREAVAAI
jgi:hypothetical protein